MIKALGCILLLCVSSFSYANSFSAIVSPPRFEGNVKSGQVYRDVIEMTNDSESLSSYRIRTNEWSFDENYGVVFQDELKEGSCRPWVVLESEQVTLKKTGRFRPLDLVAQKT